MTVAADREIIGTMSMEISALERVWTMSRKSMMMDTQLIEEELI